MQALTGNGRTKWNMENGMEAGFIYGIVGIVL